MAVLLVHRVCAQVPEVLFGCQNIFLVSFKSVDNTSTYTQVKGYFLFHIIDQLNHTQTVWPPMARRNTNSLGLLELL